MTKQYEANKRWRQRNPKKRAEATYRYYRKHPGRADVAWTRYTKVEDDAIMTSELSDSDLSEALGRSVRAIQIRRNRLKNRL